MDNQRDYVTKRLRSFCRSDVVISDHARIRLLQRQISEDEIIENVINPTRLRYAIPEKAEHQGEEKFDCYFEYSKRLCHKYILVIKDKVIIVTVVKISRKWQEIVEKKLLSNPRYR